MIIIFVAYYNFYKNATLEKFFNSKNTLLLLYACVTEIFATNVGKNVLQRFWRLLQLVINDQKLS